MSTSFDPIGGAERASGYKKNRNEHHLYFLGKPCLESCRKAALSSYFEAQEGGTLGWGSDECRGCCAGIVGDVEDTEQSWTFSVFSCLSFSLWSFKDWEWDGMREGGEPSLDGRSNWVAVGGHSANTYWASTTYQSLFYVLRALWRTKLKKKNLHPIAADILEGEERK